MAEPTKEEQEQIDFAGFGMRTRVRGHDVIVVVLVVLLFGALGYLVHEHDLKSVKIVDELSLSQQKILNEVSALTYVMTLSPEDRVKLRLDMPESLRKKLSDQR
jgi:hypothetical protein